MVREITGDLLQCDANIICHQVNFEGVMGGGIAYAIASRLFTPEQYQLYQVYCTELGYQALGTVLFTPVGPRRLVANVFSQHSFNLGLTDLTNYQAVYAGFQQVRGYAGLHKMSVAIPGYYGCGIAGGLWQSVRGIILDLYKDSDVQCTIVYWNKENQNKEDK